MIYFTANFSFPISKRPICVCMFQNNPLFNIHTFQSFKPINQLTYEPKENRPSSTDNARHLVFYTLPSPLYDRFLYQS